MRVILLADIRGLGKKNEVREVSDGHARNFLFPRLLAAPATPAAVREIEAKKAARAEADEEYVKRLREMAGRLNQKGLEFRLRTDARGSVFGSVTKDMILKALKDQGLAGTERLEIHLAHPIKEFGEHSIRVDFKKGVGAELTLKVLPQP